jgi:hypothetical protein
MSSALDRTKDADGAPPDAPAAPVGAAARDTADLRDGVRRAHGFALTDDEIVRVVDGTIQLADRVLIAAASAADAGKPIPPALPAASAPSPSFADRPAQPERPLPLDRDIMPEPRIVLRDAAAGRAVSLVRLGLAVAASLAAAVLVAGNPLSGGRIATGGSPAAPAHATDRSSAETPAQQLAVAQIPAAPQLQGGDAEPATSRTAPGPSVETSMDDGGPAVGRHSAGASLAADRADGSDRSPARVAEPAMVPPPLDLAGTLDLPVEVPAPAIATAAEADRPAGGFTARKLDAEEIAALRRRGEDFFAHGDVAAARLVLRRAAEAADARAAFALAATYDPIVLGDRGGGGATPDPATARTWYERAKAFGSPEAPRRLELLARSEH